ncbi:MAG: hypothetical protein HYZ28_14625 [Myxococcales bacterium]|nr:hypothetical protein [Myxococcales bacterium]
MARFKFLVFALVVLGLGVAHLLLMAPALSARAIEQAAGHATAAGWAVGLRVQERRIDVQKAALRLASSGPMLSALKGLKAEPPSPEKLAQVRTAALEALPEALRASAVVGLVTEAGGIYARGAGEPSTDKSALEVASLAGSGADGAAQAAFGAPHIFYPVAFFAPEKNEAKVFATVVLGVPLLPDDLAEAVAAEGRLGAVTVSLGGAVVASGGPEKAVAERAQKELKPGQVEVVGRGEAMALGPLKLPFYTSRDLTGGSAALWVASRQEVRATPFEVVGVASLRPFMQSLADYQRTALFALGGLLGLTLLWTLLMGSGRPRAQLDASARATEPELPRAAAPAPALAPEQVEQAAEAAPAEFPFEPLPAPPEEAAAGGAEQAPPSEPPSPYEAENPFEQPPPPPPDEAEGAPPEAGDPFSDPSALAPPGDDRTVAYPGPPPAEGGPPPPPPGGEDDNPDATRVASVPQELLQASARAGAEPEYVSRPMVSAVLPQVQPLAAPLPPLDPDEQHFQEVYRDFVATREQCGEGADGLNYERFALKLRKNRDQLVQKYACRTVRFHVYVKEGKAALKATPVKE